MADAPVFLTTKEVAALLRVKERKVYDLAAAGDIPFRRVTGRLLFPRAEIEAWLAAGSDPRVEAASASVASPRRPNIVVGSHDPLLEEALRASGSGLASLFDGSLDGLERIAAGEAAGCGLHLPEERGNIAGISARIEEDAFVLIEWARRQQGLIFRSDLALAPTSVLDLKGLRVVERQPKAGSRLLLERLLEEAGLERGALSFTEAPARTEAEAAQLVASGKADAALGLQAMAQAFGLGFAPVAQERFDLLIERRAYFEPPFQRLLDHIRTSEFVERASELGGYDVSGCGRVVWNGV